MTGGLGSIATVKDNNVNLGINSIGIVAKIL